MDTVSAFKLEVREDKIAVITIDAPGEKMNTLKAEFGNQVRGLIRQIRDDKSVRGVVFISAKADNFIAGADINMIARCRSAQEAEALARRGAADYGRNPWLVDSGHCRHPWRLSGRRTGAGAGLPWPHL